MFPAVLQGMAWEDSEAAKAYYKTYKREYAKAHREEQRLADKKHYWRNREKAAEQWKSWYYEKGGKQKVAAARKKDPEANRARDLMRKYKLSMEQYEKMLQGQDEKCKICGTKSMKSLHVDHNHATGEIRGLLCRACNNGLGHFRDSVELLEGAVAYLKGA